MPFITQKGLPLLSSVSGGESRVFPEFSYGGLSALSEPSQLYPVDRPDNETLAYFKKNPHVAGMAVGGGLNGYDGPRRVFVNPYSNLSSRGKSGLVMNERLRHFMDEVKPDLSFSLTKEQLEKFKDTEYGKAENVDRLKETIIARILTNDPSAMNATKEQKRVAWKIYEAFQKKTNPSIVDVVMSGIGGER